MWSISFGQSLPDCNSTFTFAPLQPTLARQSISLFYDGGSALVTPLILNIFYHPQNNNIMVVNLSSWSKKGGRVENETWTELEIICTW